MIRRGDVDVAVANPQALGRCRRRQDRCTIQDDVQHAGRFRRRVDDHADRGAEIRRQTCREATKRLDAAGGGADDDQTFARHGRDGSVPGTALCSNIHGTAVAAAPRFFGRSIPDAGRAPAGLPSSRVSDFADGEGIPFRPRKAYTAFFPVQIGRAVCALPKRAESADTTKKTSPTPRR